MFNNDGLRQSFSYIDVLHITFRSYIHYIRHIYMRIAVVGPIEVIHDKNYICEVLCIYT